MKEPLHAVFDDFGRQIGAVQRVWLGRSKSEFWNARALDGADLGSHAHRDDAHDAIRDDWDRGRPRDPDSPTQRWRPIHARNAGKEPLYLGR